MLGWSLGLDPDFYIFFHTESGVDAEGNLRGFNDVEFSNPELDELLERGRKEMDQEERRKIYVEAQKIVNDERTTLLL